MLEEGGAGHTFVKMLEALVGILPHALMFGMVADGLIRKVLSIAKTHTLLGVDIVPAEPHHEPATCICSSKP
jgi:hypothetical protein